MSGSQVAAVIAMVCLVAFVAGVLVGRGTRRHQRQSGIGEIAKRTLAIETEMMSVSEDVTAIRANAASELGTLSEQLRDIAQTNRGLSRVLDKPKSRGDLGE